MCQTCCHNFRRVHFYPNLTHLAQQKLLCEVDKISCLTVFSASNPLFLKINAMNLTIKTPLKPQKLRECKKTERTSKINGGKSFSIHPGEQFLHNNFHNYWLFSKHNLFYYFLLNYTNNCIRASMFVIRIYQELSCILFHLGLKLNSLPEFIILKLLLTKNLQGQMRKEKASSKNTTFCFLHLDEVCSQPLATK